MNDQPPDSSDLPPLEPGVDFYFDASGLMVLTADYLRRRGYCCKNGCRHCPYGFGRERDASG